MALRSYLLRDFVLMYEDHVDLADGPARHDADDLHGVLRQCDPFQQRICLERRRLQDALLHEGTTTTTFLADGPLAPCSMSKVTVSASFSDLNPCDWIAEKWTKTSFCPSTLMKPKPFAALNHFTLPVVLIQMVLLGVRRARSRRATGHPSRDGLRPSCRGERSRLARR